MKNSKNHLALAALLLCGFSIAAFAAGGGGAALESPRIDQTNTKSLQNGAKIFVNYCMGCHSADYHRYSIMARDLGLSEQEVSDNLIFTTDKVGAPTKVGSLMVNNMTKDYGSQAFGVMPPNLALTARSRGVDWIYTYLKSFYLDAERPMGVNNVVYPGASMPHALWELQGWQKPVYKEKEQDGVMVEYVAGLELVKAGLQTPAEYDKTVADLTNFLAYLSDPVKAKRHKIGMYVMLFLFLLLGLTYFLKKEYWKDVV